MTSHTEIMAYQVHGFHPSRCPKSMSFSVFSFSRLQSLCLDNDYHYADTLTSTSLPPASSPTKLSEQSSKNINLITTLLCLKPLPCLPPVFRIKCVCLTTAKTLLVFLLFRWFLYRPEPSSLRVSLSLSTYTNTPTHTFALYFHLATHWLSAT